MEDSLVSAAQRQSFKAYRPWNTVASNIAPSRKVTKISAAQAVEPPRKTGVSSPKSAAGFLLMDCYLRLISFNAEAVQILGYPDSVANLVNPEALLREKIRSSLITESVFVTEFRSGRRRYFCRAFLIDSHTDDPSHRRIAVLLERGPSGWVPLQQIAQQFNLTEREREVLEYLLQGMGNKDIANRMKLSTNTVKAFLRLIMIKAGVSSRSMIMARIIMTALATPRNSQASNNISVECPAPGLASGEIA
jgi:DNA-binding CsgD family transcriptional regulator